MPTDTQQTTQPTQQPDVLDAAISSVVPASSAAPTPTALSPTKMADPSANGGVLGSAALGALKATTEAHNGTAQPAPQKQPDVLDAAIQSVTNPNVATQAPEKPSTLGRVGNAVKEWGSDAVAPIKAAMQPPQDAKEEAALAAGGPLALETYRAGKTVVEGTENVFKAKGDAFQKAKTDFVQGVKDFHNKDYRNYVSDAGSTASDLISLVPGGDIVGPKFRELSEGARPGGDLVTPVTKDILDVGSVALADKASEAAATKIKALPPVEDGFVRIQSSDGAIHDLPQENLPVVQARDGGIRVVKSGKVVAPPATEINPEQHLVYREAGPKPQHGTPVATPQPLDNATITNLKGGNKLSPEAMNQLRVHVGGTPGQEIEVGSTPENVLHKASAPLQKTLTETGLKMNQAILDAPAFETSIADAGQLDKTLDSIRSKFPGGDEEKLNAAFDKEIQNAQSVLASKDPKELLAYRRQLSPQIDFRPDYKVPSTSIEAQNEAQRQIYFAIGDKLHTEIPATAALDKVVQPNLELQSFLDRNGVDRDPVLADAEHVSELQKGRNQLAVNAHNEVVARNRELAGLDKSDVQPTVGTQTGSPTKVDVALDRAVGQFNLTKPAEQSALRQLLQPSVKAGKLWGTNTDYVGALNQFDQLSPAERAARFSNPNAVRNVLRTKARTQMLVKYGSIGAAALAAHETGIDRAALHLIMGG